MAIKKAARKVARKAVSKVKRAGKGGSRKRVVRKSSKKVKRVTKGRVPRRKISRKKLTSKKKKVSKKSRVTRKRRLSTKKTTSSRKRIARKPSTKRRRRKQKTEEVVAVDQEETAKEQAVVVDELKAEGSDEASTTENDFDCLSLETQENVAPKEETVVETDSVSGYEIHTDNLVDEPVEDVQKPEQESLPESREPETESREPERSESLDPPTLFESTGRESEPESDYVIVTKEDAEKLSEVGATEETSVVEEEPVLANNNQNDTEPGRNVESDEDVRRWQEEEAEAQHDDSSSLPSFGVRDVPDFSEINTYTSAVPMM
jgi:hypothetical protein